MNRLILGCLTLAAAFTLRAQSPAYDPLAIGAAEPKFIDLTTHDTARNRDIPVRVYLPAETGPEPVVLFSHGLGGSRAGSRFMGEHWAARGYVAVFLQHPGSDESVWKDKSPMDGFEGMKRAVTLENFLARVQDVPAVLDQLAVWNTATNGPLTGRMNLKKIGMSGHSFGAVTTEAVSGESLPLSGQRFTDARITAAIAFSPSPSKTGTPERSFGAVKIPWMLMTGTQDNSPPGLGDLRASARLTVYPALKLAPKYELVLNNAEHSVFTERALPGDHEPRNPNHHRVILALSTAFWDTYLRDDPAARAWLNSQSPRRIMETEDQWRFAIP